MKPAMIVRELHTQDWDLLSQVANLDREAFLEDGLAPANLVLMAHAGRIFISQKGPAVIGSAIVLPTGTPGETLLFSLAVQTSARNQGVGSALLASVLERLAKDGCHRMILTVGPENKPAIKVYMNRLGFRKVADLPNHFGPGKDRLLLEKVLAMAECP